ncbi:MAG: BON domain-containing protein [Chitinivibrionales bacterium]|nr:BON domain-containing protein [Chitinivibrionales bacterium]
MPTNEKIKKDIVDMLYWDNRIDASKVNVEVTDGNVALTGNVPTFRARNAAFDDACSVAGARSVENDVVVSWIMPPEIPTDEEIAGRINDVLLWSADIDHSTIEVEVTDGWVTLRGTVASYWKKMRTEDLVSEVRGIVSISNELAVTPTEQYLDRAIAEDIVAALERDSAIDPEFIDVKVEDGVVTLSGKVLTWADSRTVGRIARLTAGVRDVINLMSIE